MDSVLAKVQKLVALSASASEDEARNASLAACRLIREHKLVVALPPAAPAAAADDEPPAEMPVLFRWERMTKDDRLFRDPWCDRDGCYYARATWQLCSPDRVTVKGFLCDAHMAELAAQASHAPHRARPGPRAAAPERPIDLARAASDAATEALGTAGEAIGRAAGQRLVKGLKNVLRGR